MTARPSLAGIAERHVETEGPWPPEGHVCIRCWERWPCDASILAALEAQG